MLILGKRTGNEIMKQLYRLHILYNRSSKRNGVEGVRVGSGEARITAVHLMKLF